MEQRCWNMWSTFLAVIFFSCIVVSYSAPAFKIKHYNFYKPKEMSPARVERRLIGGSSPIHFISPFVPMPEPVMNPFFSVSTGSSPKSKIYKLPLRLRANGKLHNVIHGFPDKRDYFMDRISHTSSNVIQLPLKYISNAKPIGIYFQNPSMNFL